MAVSILHGESPLNDVEDLKFPNFLLHKIFEKLLKTAGPSITNKCAIVCREKSLTFGQLNALANRLARTLTNRIQANIKNTLDKPKLIGVALAPSERLVITLLAILKCGGAYLPLDVTFPEPRLRHILTEAKPLMVIRECQAPQDDIEDLMTEIATNYEDLFQEGLNYSSDDLADEDCLSPLEKDGTSVTCVLYTSGSTGIPKGVVLPHKVVVNRLRWQWTTFPFQENEVCCFKTVLTFVDSVAEIFAPLLQGRKLVVIPRSIVQDPELLVAELEKHAIHRLVLVPSLLRALLTFVRSQKDNTGKTNAALLTNLRKWICSGEPLTERLLREFFCVFPTERTVCNFYGSTEVMADVTYSVFTSLGDVKELVLDGKVPIGMAVDNTNIYVLDEAMQLIPLGGMGEVYVSGFNVAAGYLSQAVKSDERFLPNSIFSGPGHDVLYRTGDFGRIVNGLLYYEGRTDSQIKVRGQRVDLTEIQRAASQIPGVHKAIALCYQPNEPAQTIVLFYLPTEDNSQLTEAQVTAQLHRKLVTYMMPYVIKMEAIPLLHNGKVDRQSLLQHFEKVTSSSEQITIDLSGVEEEEVEAATTLLTVTATTIFNASGGRWGSKGKDNSNVLTVDADFFSVGGNSLNALQVLSALRDRGYHVSVADFLQGPTLRHVLHKINFDSQHQEIHYELLNSQDAKSKYSFLELRHVQPDVGIPLTAQSFAYRGDLELLLGASVEDSVSLLQGWWPALVETGLSFAVEDCATKEIVATALNFDVHDEPAADASPTLQPIFDFLEFVEQPTLLHELPPDKGTVVHSCLMATALHLPPAENIRLVQLMEEHNIDVAKQKKYKVVFTTNTSEVTKDICQELFGYQVFNDVQVNKYVDKEGRQVFANAPDDYHVYVAAKFLS